MKPLRLEFQAFGSYPNKEVVDFTVLARRGLFVVTGPTGTGKSTIFDAMVYALYGKLPGSRAGDDVDCRSQHASLSTETYVQFDFEIDGVVYRVERKPTQLRAAKKGGGTAKQNAEASLVKVVGGSIVPITTKVSPVTVEVEALVGLDASQFQRVVLLPQGAFTAFLLAGEMDREKLLRPLFGGEVYQRATEWLKSEMIRLDKVVGQSDEQIRHHQRNAADSLRKVLSAWTDDEALDVDELVAELLEAGDAAMLERITKLEAEEVRLRAELDQLEAAAKAAGDVAATAEVGAKLFDDVEAKRANLAELQAQREDIEAKRTRASDSKRARPVEKAHGDVERAKSRLRDAEAALQALLTAVREGFQELGRPVPEPTQQSVSGAVSSAVQELEADKGLLEAAGKAQAAVTEAEGALAEAEAALTKARAEAASAAEKVKAEQDRVDVLSPLASAVPTRQVEADRAAQVLADRRDLEAARGAAVKAAEAVAAAAAALTAAGDAVAAQQAQVDALSPRAAEVPTRRAALNAAETAVAQRKRLTEAQTALDAAARKAAVANDEYVKVMAQFIATQAPRLAETLKAGDPCPVCGSAEHPSPARLDAGDSVDHTKVDKARAEVGVAEGNVAAAQTEVNNFTELLGASASLSVEEVVAARDAASSSLQEAVDAERDLGAAQKALSTANASLEQARKTEADCVTERALADQKVAALETSLGDQSSVDVAVLEAASSTAAASLKEALDAERDLGAAQKALSTANEALTTAQTAEAECVTKRAVADSALTGRRDALNAAQAAAAHINPKALVMRLAVAEGLAERLHDADEVFGGVTASTAALEVSSKALADALAASGFAAVDAAVAVCLDAQEEAALESSVQQWDKDLASCNAALKALEARDVPSVRPDAEALGAAATAASKLAKDQSAAFTAACVALADARKSLQAASDAGADSAADRAARDVARRVHNTCNGEAGIRVKLERWVLARELERVTVAANAHLARMSNGRYQLHRDATKGGLRLEVLDAHTGKRRATNSLSGGEQFQASLSLALGLADVVSRGGSGNGKQFEALFVDEGFGSLDQDALTQAIDALEQIQATGRMVGAITHVEEMKQRLHKGIEVMRLANDSGSTLRVNP